MARRMLSPITSNKHYVHIPVFTVTAASRVQTTVVNAVAKGTAITTADQVDEGSTIKAVYVELWISGVTANLAVQACLVKRPASVSGPTFGDMAAMGTYPNKKNVFEYHQGLAPTGGNQMAIFRHWIKIPKGKQRFGLDDLLVIVTSALGTNINVCGFATYKEYT